MTHKRLWIAMAPLVLGLTVSTCWGTTCVGSLTSSWPPENAVLPLNARILIGAYGWEGNRLLDVMRHRPVLDDSDRAVPLHIVESYTTSPFRQVVLQPSRLLKPKVEYLFRLSAPPENRHLLFKLTSTWNNDGHTWRPTKWMSGATTDEAPPVWTGDPVVVEARSRRSLWGDWANVTVEIPASDNGNFMQATVSISQAEGNGEPIRYRLPVESGRIVLRSELCTPFHLLAGARYEMHVTLVDVAGNVSPAPNGPIEFRVSELPPPDRFEVSVDLPHVPRVISGPNLVYPEIAEVGRISGEIDLELIVAPGGTVQAVHIRAGIPWLAEYTAETLRAWVFEPAKDSQHDRSVPMTVHFTIITPDGFP